MFQFRCGFSVPCDEDIGRDNQSGREFQFRCGFSVPCDGFLHALSFAGRHVSIPLWIFCSLRRCGRRPRRSPEPVSIPLWIFCSLRRRLSESTPVAISCFNSVVDFLFPATFLGRSIAVCDQLVSIPLWIFCSLRPSSWTFRPCSNASFNSVVDFLFPATGVVKVNTHGPYTFQFRCGFSVPCDTSPRRPRGGRRMKFQFRCGFSVPCDAIFHATISSRVVRFNSVVDFLFPATLLAIKIAPRVRQVSIPLWIFCSLRPL